MNLWPLKHSIAQARPPVVLVRKEEHGSALLVVLVLLSLMVGLAMANIQVLRHLHLEMRLIEHRQLRKFEHHPAATNQVAVAVKHDAVHNPIIEEQNKAGKE
jgi:hypothetical protein